ncbi:hypothetical protein ACPOL_0620 [Acidisarcina polymorpha]|uniref:Uncharacterized protein n=1 Tax=Acidisarcina polymorpha TaxID=2211140 RepID=A0A2Z5FT19_9BACT|nr:hypothetical protein ACPOL_0620 [Acidisarcina polymorpha]
MLGANEAAATMTQIVLLKYISPPSITLVPWERPLRRSKENIDAALLLFTCRR